MSSKATQPPCYNCPESYLKHYTCHRTPTGPVIDGRLDEAVWLAAPKSPRFEDLVTGVPGLLDTRAALLWDDVNLYVAFWVDEPNVRATLTERDSLVFTENDVEVFIAGEDCYYEFEINCLGTVFEVFYIWQDAYKRGSRFDTPEFVLLNQKVDVLGGLDERTHPRGERWAFRDWDFPGMQCAVQVDGKVNDPSIVDRGWTVEIAFPWDGMKILAGSRPVPPKHGDTWRMDFSRFQIVEQNGVTANPGWVWNRHGIYDSHIPECFTYIHFSEETSDARKRES